MDLITVIVVAIVGLLFAGFLVKRISYFIDMLYQN